MKARNTDSKSEIGRAQNFFILHSDVFLLLLLYTDRLAMQAQSLMDSVRSGDARALARAISTVENRAPGWSDLLKALFPHTGRARVIGLTGAPYQSLNCSRCCARRTHGARGTGL